MAKTVLEPKDTVGLGSGIVMKQGKKNSRAKRLSSYF